MNLPQFLAASLAFLFASCINSNASRTVDDDEKPEFSEILPSDSNDLVKLTAAINSTYYIPGKMDDGAYLYLEVKTKPIDLEGRTRKPLNISLVIDRSGSMSGDKMEYAKKAAAFVVDNLNSNDYLSIVSYDDEVETEWASGLIKDKTLIKSKIESLFDRGSTNLGGGMLQGYDEGKKTFNVEYTNRVLLLTDGLANVGVTDPLALGKIARNMNIENNISLSTFGVGIDYNEDLLQSLAENGGGNYYFIASPDEIPNIFKQEMDGLLAVIAQNTKLEVSLPKGVTVQNVFGFKSEIEDGNLGIYFRDLSANDTKGVLIKFSVDETFDGDLQFASKLNYTEAIGEMKNQELLVNMVMQPTTDNALVSEHRSKTVEQWVTFYEANLVIEKAMEEADKGNYDKARSLLKGNNVYMEERSYRWGLNASASKAATYNSAYDSVVVEMEDMDEDVKKGYQKEFKNENYKMKVRK